MEIIVLISFLCLIVIIQMVFFVRSIKRPSPLKALVVSGKIDPDNSVAFKIHTEGLVFVWPVIQESYFLDLGNYSIKQNFKVTASNGVNSSVEVEAFVKPNKENLPRIVGDYFDASKSKIEVSIAEEIEMLIKGVISQSNLEAGSKVQLITEIKEKVNLFLVEKGFKVTEMIHLVVR